MWQSGRVANNLRSDKIPRSILNAWKITARYPRYYVSMASMLLLVLMEILEHDFGFCGANKVAERVKVRLTNLLNRFKGI